MIWCQLSAAVHSWGVGKAGAARWGPAMTRTGAGAKAMAMATGGTLYSELLDEVKGEKMSVVVVGAVLTGGIQRGLERRLRWCRLEGR